jgi:uncharacterized protein (TIGR02271 family)
MAQKLIGFYASRDTAKRVEDDLIAAGFDHDDVSVFSGSEGPGLWQDIKEFFGFADESERQVYAEAARRGQAAVLVTLDDDEAPSESRGIEIMQRYNPIDLNTEAQQWRAQGWTGKQAAAQTTTAQASAGTQASAGKQAIPVVEERLQVGKRRVLTGGVRLHSYVIEKPVQANVQLREEHVTVERRPTDRPLGAGDQPFQERQVEVTETAEQPVISKEARVVEEVVVGKSAQQRTQTVRDTVKRTDVQVEKVSPDDAQVADKFATEIARDDRYRNKDWTSLEPQVRQSFEQRYPGSKWEQFKDDIQRRWERARQKV